MVSLLWLLFAVLLVLWFIGYSVAWGAFINLLLVVAVIVLLLNVISAIRRGRWY